MRPYVSRAPLLVEGDFGHRAEDQDSKIGVGAGTTRSEFVTAASFRT